jgi:hypothetical protein
MIRRNDGDPAIQQGGDANSPFGIDGERVEALAARCRRLADPRA